MPTYELRPIAGEEVEPFLLAAIEGFHDDPVEEELAMFRSRLEPERALAVFADGDVVATCGLHGYELTVPGAVVRMAGVTAVTVHAVHRRRGLLRTLMRGQLEAIHERGEEAIAGLWASEAGIYGRFGFGLAAPSADLRVRSPLAHLVQPAPEQRPRQVEPADATAELAAVYDAVRARLPGMLSRAELDWRHAIWHPESRREGAKRLRAVIQDGPGGEPAGYALYAIRKHDGDDWQPDDEVDVHELLATTPEASASLWEHLLRMSLARRVRYDNAPADEPLFHMLTDARAAGLRVLDGLFARLVDVPRALAERTYATPVDVVLDVADPLCPWNEGRWRLAGDPDGAACERTRATADLALSATDLGTVHLGGPTLAVLGAAGRVRECTAGALAAASLAFRGTREPWCPEHF
jgi:predicted acetyltransferase